MGFKTRLGGCCAILFLLFFAGGAYGGEATVSGKIVSLAPSITETLFAMGLGQRIAGTTEHSDYPLEAKNLPSVGQFMNPELERILALRPAACIGLAGSTSPLLIQSLKTFGIQTFLVKSKRMDDFLHSLGLIGTYLGESALGSRLQREYAMRLDGIREKVADLDHPRVLCVISVSPIFCAGPNTFIADVVRCAGGEPIGLGMKDWQGLSREAILWLNPDIIVFAAHTGVVPEWMSRPPLDKTCVVNMDPALIIRPTPRLIDSAEKLADSFHAENVE